MESSPADRHLVLHPYCQSAVFDLPSQPSGKGCYDASAYVRPAGTDLTALIDALERIKGRRCVSIVVQSPSPPEFDAAVPSM